MPKGVYTRTAEQRAKLSEHMKRVTRAKPGLKLSDAERQAISDRRKGVKLSQEHRDNLSRAHMGNPGYWTGKKRGPHTAEWKAAIGAANKGKTHTKESREKIAASLSGRKRPPEVVAKMSAAMKGKRPTKEALVNIRAAAKKRSGPANNRWGLPPPHGKRVEYNGTTYRSSYEVRFAKALDALGIKWEYEPTRFDLGTCTYLPDFYIPDDGAYWEVKGWLGPDSQKKIARFREVNPDIPLIVATDRVIKTFERLAFNQLEGDPHERERLDNLR